MTKEENTSDEWVMLSARDPMNYYLGKIVYEQQPEIDPYSGIVHNIQRPEELRNYVKQMLFHEKLLHLTETRLLMIMMQPTPQGMGILPQLVPMAGHIGPIDMYLKTDAVIFPNDMPGMAKRITEMVVAVEEMEIRTRARAAGIQVGGPMPTDINSKRS